MRAARDAMRIHHRSVATSMPLSVLLFPSVAGAMCAIVQRISAFLSVGMDGCSGRAYRARVVSEMLFQQFADMCRWVSNPGTVHPACSTRPRWRADAHPLPVCPAERDAEYHRVEDARGGERDPDGVGALIARARSATTDMGQYAYRGIVRSFWRPEVAVYPGVLIFMTVLAYNFFGDGLHDALDPRYRHRNF
jgi:hypothetical protein